VCYVSATRYKSDDTKPYIFKTSDYGKTWTLITNGLPKNTYNRCVREDPNKKGILYCGTETGIYISFDDGARWQSLQLNLPNTPIHDIQVHPREKDLVVATHGRAFWVLDDITPLYQLSDEIAKSKSWLYKPRDTYRTPGGYIDDPKIQEGTNAPNGVIIRYYLKDKPEKELKLKFQTATGDSIITYSSLKNTRNEPVVVSRDFYESKAKRPGLLTIDSGMNVFVWDMQYPAAKADPSAAMEGTVSGPEAVPGTYTAKLYLGDSLLQTTQFNIIPDPRNPFTVADLKEQFDLGIKVHNKLDSVGKATKQIRSVKDQISALLASTEDSADVRAMRALAQPITDSLTNIENALYNNKIKSGEDNLRFPMRLEEKLCSYNAGLLASDSKPTAAMYDTYTALSSRIDVQLQKLKAVLDTSLPKLNDLIRSKGKAVIDTKVKA
jgi:hypothetical protein